MAESLNPSVIKALETYDSATVSNAIEDFQVRDRTEGYASMALRCQFPELKPMVGYAVTCTMDTTSPGRKSANRLHEFLDLLSESAKPTVVVIKDVGSSNGRSCFGGDLICGVYSKLGVVGVVTDGGMRDLQGIRKQAPNLQVFCPGVVVSHGNGVKIDLNIPVNVGGMVVNPGDLIHGDDNGIVNVPLNIAEAVIDKSRQVRETETKLFEYLKSPSVTLEGLKSHIGRPTNA